jgi:imidazole glycerol-phosphate synthase subunit HisH
MSNVVVLDYGVVNLKNVVRGLEYAGADVITCRDPERLRYASRLVLPGVGAFKSGMAELTSRGFDESLTESVNIGIPTLGICLGMQLFMESSTEHGSATGLGLIPGTVEEIPKRIDDVADRKIPHIGWSEIFDNNQKKVWDDSCLRSVPNGSFCYFAHSFMARPTFSGDILAKCFYQGLPIAAAIKRGNITGLQFHPERSGPVGLKILKDFIFFD